MRAGGSSTVLEIGLEKKLKGVFTMKQEATGFSRLRLVMRSVSAIAFLTLSAVAAYGQGGSITGTVNDPSGAAVVTASINAKNVETGAVFNGGATNTGNYVIAVPAGNYELTVRPDMGCSGTTAYTIGYTDAPDVPKDGDVEPNDTFALARPLPRNCVRRPS